MPRAAMCMPLLLCACNLLDSSPLGERSGACELRPAKDQCTDIREFKGPTLATFQLLCESLTAAVGGGEYLEDATCDTTGAWGGCQVVNLDGSLQTNWYFLGGDYATIEEAQAECANNQDWVDPD
jgi:hypothetical protein